VIGRSGRSILSRRGFLGALGAGLLGPALARSGAVTPPLFRIRTITAGISLRSAGDVEALDEALAFLDQSQQPFVAAGYEVQTVRIATQPLAQYLPRWTDPASLPALRALDERARTGRVSFSVGPVLTTDEAAPEFAQWAAELVRATTNTSFSAFVASPAVGVHYRTARAAAEAIAAIAGATPGGEGNFRFAATAFCPPDTPFFPAAYHGGDRAFAIGLESPLLLQAAFEGIDDFRTAQARLRARMNEALAPVEQLAAGIAKASGWRYVGIDASPAPLAGASIGAAIETLTGVPFGEPPTLAACAAITEVLGTLSIRTCGYNGLMLPVLEDPVLARRAGEGRFGVSELLLYSSVCGTGLDVVPLPGDTPIADLAAAIVDVAALARRYQKPLSARLFPVPGKRAGELVTFDNPYLTDARVMALGQGV
jgi:uncharacterized protein (UPF0210 family)